jgi:hypothetical protein
MTLNDLQQMAGILIGFQITIFTFRITRELNLDRKQRWFPLPDFINLISVLITVLFIFIYPLKTNKNIDLLLCKDLFGLSILLFVIYPFALVGHYDLFQVPSRRNEQQKYITKQEMIVLIIGLFMTVIYSIL